MAITSSPFWDQFPNFNAPVNQNAPVPFNINPAPTTGTGEYGMVPGAVGLPNPAGDLGAQYPNLGGTNQAISGAISNQLAGQLSPGTIKMMQDAQAAQAIKGGMPGTNVRAGTLYGNRSVRDLGRTAEQQVQEGITNYNRTIPTVSGTQTVNPALQNEIAMWNAINRSAPDPAAAGNYAKMLFDQYLNQMRGGGRGGGPAAGTGQFQPPVTQPTWQQTHPGLTPGFAAPSAQKGINSIALQNDPNVVTFPDGTMVDGITGQYLGMAAQSGNYTPVGQTTWAHGVDASTYDPWGVMGEPTGTIPGEDVSQFDPYAQFNADWTGALGGEQSFPPEEDSNF